jgi:hypothetical protein
LRAERKAGRSPHPNQRTATGLTCSRPHDNTGRPTIDEACCIRDARSGHELRGGHDRDGRADRAALLPAGGSGDHDIVERNGGGGENEAYVGCPYPNDLRRRSITDPCCAERDFALGKIADAEFAIRACHHVRQRTDENDRRPLDGSGKLIHDRSGNRRLLRRDR